MADLIDRAALLADIERDIENSGCVNHEREIMDCIRYAPTVKKRIDRQKVKALLGMLMDVVAEQEDQE